MDGTPNNKEGESALAIFCRNAETVKKKWYGRITGMMQRMNKTHIYFSKNITVVSRKEEDVESARPRVSPS